jgi:hypothetical protein
MRSRDLSAKAVSSESVGAAARFPRRKFHEARRSQAASRPFGSALRRWQIARRKLSRNLPSKAVSKKIFGRPRDFLVEKATRRVDHKRATRAVQ